MNFRIEDFIIYLLTIHIPLTWKLYEGNIGPLKVKKDWHCIKNEVSHYGFIQ